tara:strand:+ start:686 stop:1411 length:726 start_codon:yes stop_codon:yes gene_type:complete
MLGLGASLSGGTTLEITPSDISGLQIWYKNNTNVGVDQWDDSSGNGRHAAQGTANARGTVSDGGILFDDSDPEDFYNITESTGYVNLGHDNAYTVAIVFTRQVDDTVNAIVGGATNSHYLAIWNEEQILTRATSPDITSTFTFEENTFLINTQMLLTITKDTSGDFKFYKNGAEISTTSTNNPTNTGTTFVAQFLGSRHDGTATSDFQWDGVIYEMALYNTELTGSDLTNLNNYLTGKFGL